MSVYKTTPDRPTSYRHKVKKVLASGCALLPKDKLKLHNLKAKVLMYHRVIDPEEIPWYTEPGMYTRPETFEMQVDFLSKNYNILSLDQLVKKIISQGSASAEDIAITFDDGWLDNFTIAAPILKKYKAPAAIFLATDFIGENNLFWSDKIALAIQHCREDLFELFENHGIFTPRRAKHSLTVLTKDNFNFEKSFLALKTVSPETRSAIVEEISNSLPKQERQFMNWSEVNELALQNISFGSHTSSHCYATEMSGPKFLEDLSASFSLLKEKLNPNLPLEIFCYPVGYYNALSQEKLAESEISAAMAVHFNNKLSESPPIIGRIGIHEDISYSKELFDYRIAWQSKT